MADTRILYITPDLGVEVRTVDGSSLKVMQKLVGGYIEVITGERFIAFVNEHGRIDELPANLLASALAFRFGWRRAATEPLAGPVVFLGAQGMGDEVQSVSDELINEAHATAQRMAKE